MKEGGVGGGWNASKSEIIIASTMKTPTFYGTMLYNRPGKKCWLRANTLIEMDQSRIPPIPIFGEHFLKGLTVEKPKKGLKRSFVKTSSFNGFFNE